MVSETTLRQLLEDQILLTNENEYMRGLLDSFWTGDVPDKASFNHLILAKAGRLRLAEKSKTCALLAGKV